MDTAIKCATTFVVCIREWFDKVNGNTYFGGHVVECETGRVEQIPFQYGHGRWAHVNAASVAMFGHRDGIDPQDRTVEVFASSVSRMRDAKNGARYAV